MKEVTYFTHSDNAINYHSRNSTQGAELNMVKGFVEYVINSRGKKNVAVFIEPQLESGYPDIVFVEYSSLNSIQKNKYRNKLSSIDLKILYEIIQHECLSITYFQEHLGYTINQINKTLKALELSDLISISSSRRYVRKHLVRSFFKIKRIVSVEAKIGKWHDVIDQSFTNQWFSSESYVLLDKQPNTLCEEICKKYGTGIITACNNGYLKNLESAWRKQPVSYVSLLFNEWIIRRKFEEEGIDE